ncbi:uncharacterized protein LOC131242834 [Magnolia sinica]|uniref:uncharacterized protein LOC131242834 n=1 Tax=Magnolia sinica TaxID=86752 RepID=UPI00265B5537|nr:uncharacterized protein LOC131242834 [Magnolia sinica]
MAEPLNLENPTITKPKKIQLSSSTFLFTISLSLVSFSLLYLSCKDTTFWFLLSNAIIFFIAADSNAFSPSKPKPDLYDEYLKHARSQNTFSHYTHLHPIPKSSSTEIPQEKEISETLKYPIESVNLGENYHRSESEKAIVAIKRKKKQPHQSDKANMYSNCTYKYTVSESSKIINIPQEKRELQDFVDQPSQNVLKSREKYCRSESEKAIVSIESEKKALRRSETGSRGQSSEKEADFSAMSDEELNLRIEEFIKRFNRQIRLQEMRERNENQEN